HPPARTVGTGQLITVNHYHAVVSVGENPGGQQPADTSAENYRSLSRVSTHFIALHRDCSPDQISRANRGTSPDARKACREVPGPSDAQARGATSKMFFSSPITTMLETLRRDVPGAITH